MAFVEQDKEKTFTMVFDKNYEALCLYAVKFTEDFLEAEDIVQEAFVRFWEMYRDRLTTENARPLLYRMTRNMCVDRVREKPKSVVDVEVMTDQLIYYFQPESEDDSKIDLFITPFSSSNIRRFTILEASQLMSSSVSSAWIPTNMSIPLSIEENNCCSMVTLARVTR